MPGCTVLSELDEHCLLDHLEKVRPRDRLLVVLGLNTGLRVHEILALKVGQSGPWLGATPGCVWWVSACPIRENVLEMQSTMHRRNHSKRFFSTY
jgi:hypothetical protein